MNKELLKKTGTEPNENRPGYKKTKVGWIPEEWRVKRYREIFSVIMDGTHFSPKIKDGHRRYITSKNIKNGFMDLSECSWISEEEHRVIYKSCPVKKGQLLLTKDGAKAGNACLNPLSEEFSLLSSVAVLDSRKDILVNHFALHWLLSHRGKYSLLKEVTGQAITRVTLDIISSLYMPIPLLPEQKKIAEILSTWDEAIEQIRSLIDAKKKRKKGLMQRLLTGGKRVPGFEGEWEEYKLGEIFIERLETNRTELPLLAITGNRGVIPSDEIARRDSSSEDKSRYKRIAVGDIGYNTMRMWQGVNAVSSIEGIVSPAYTICIPKNGVCGGFIAYYFKFHPVVHIFWRYSQGLVSDTLNLKFHNFSQIALKFPPKAEQQAIAEILQTADEEIRFLEDELAVLEKQKRGLLQKLLTGTIRVKA